MTLLRRKSCRRSVRLVGAVLVTGLVLVCGSAMAGEMLRQIRISPVEFQAGRVSLGEISPNFGKLFVAVQRPDSGFRKATDRFERRFLPRATSELGALSVLQFTEMPGIEVQDQVMYGQMSEAVRQFAERATRKAVKNFMIESASVDRTIDGIKSRVRTSSSDARKVRFDFGVHSAMPEVSMRYGLSDGQMKFRFSAEGKINLQYRRLSMQRAEFNLGYDGDSYRLGYILAF